MEASYGESPALLIRNVDERLGRVSAFIVCRPEKEICIILDTYMRLSEKFPVTSHRVDSVCPKRSSSRGERC